MRNDAALISHEIRVGCLCGGLRLSGRIGVDSRPNLRPTRDPSRRKGRRNRLLLARAVLRLLGGDRFVCPNLRRLKFR